MDMGLFPELLYTEYSKKKTTITVELIEFYNKDIVYLEIGSPMHPKDIFF